MNTNLNRCVASGWLRVVAVVVLCIMAFHIEAMCATEDTVESDATDEAAAVEEAAPSVSRAPVLDLSYLFPETLRRTAFGVAIWQFIVAFVFILLGFVFKKISDYILHKKVIAFLKGTRVDFDHMLVEAASGPVGVLLLILGFVGACAVLTLPEEPMDVKEFVFGIIKVCIVADVMWFLFRLVDVATEYMTRLSARTESALDDQLVPLLRKALKVTVALISAVTAMTVLGINVTGVVAGLGIGGLAIALGLQDTLANLFGSVVIFIDRPFSIGDHVSVGGVEGTVMEVGFRSTRIQTFPKTVVTIPNKIVADSTIDNVSERPKRRVLQTIGLTYETTASQMEEAVSAIRDIIVNDKGVDPEFIVVRFDDFADFSLNIMMYYFTASTGLADHKETKERINLAIMRTIDELGLSMAFPTQTLYFEGDIAKRIAATPKSS